MKNLHLEHPEDLLFDGNTNLYGSTPFACLSNTFEHIIGAKNTSISVKWDGAPAIVFGIHPTTKMFFVGTKAAFSDKFAFSENHIPLLTKSPQLREKLIAVFDLCSVVTSGVYQADVLWWNGNFQTEGDFHTIQPNTLKYLVPKRSHLGYMVRTARHGIVLHTAYTGGPKLSDMEINFEYPFLLGSEETFILNNSPLQSETFRVSIREYDQIKEAFEFLKIYDGQYPILAQLSKGRLNTLIRQFFNYCFRKQRTITDTEFCNYIRREYEKEALRLKTDKGKKRKLDEAFDLQQSLDRNELSVVLRFYQKLLEIKGYLIAILDKCAKDQYDVEVETPGHGLTGHEGFVVHCAGTTLPTFKLVNRHIFSAANMNFEKDWIGK